MHFDGQLLLRHLRPHLGWRWLPLQLCNLAVGGDNSLQPAFLQNQGSHLAIAQMHLPDFQGVLTSNLHAKNKVYKVWDDNDLVPSIEVQLLAYRCWSLFSLGIATADCTPRECRLIHYA